MFATPPTVPIYIESDSKGNVYSAPGPSAGPAVRLNSAGVTTQTYNALGYKLGIDADALGNTYLAIDNGTTNLLKFAPDGTLLNTTPLGDIFPVDVSIDEAGNKLYLGDRFSETAGVKIFDISGTAPMLIGSIATPAQTIANAVYYAPESGHVFATDWGLNRTGPRAFEFSATGALLYTYYPASTHLAFDLVTLVPEPSSISLLLLGFISCSQLSRRR